MEKPQIGTVVYKYPGRKNASFGITNVSSGADVSSIELTDIREYVHVIRVEKKWQGTANGGNQFKKCRDANFIITMIYDSLKKAYSKNSKLLNAVKNYDALFRKSTANQYKTDGKYKIFLDMSLWEKTSDNFAIKAERDISTQTQKNTSETKTKNHTYNKMAETATKLAYMLRDGDGRFKDDGKGAYENYTSDSKVWNETWKYMLGRATRFLWMEYEEWQGFHRGIDITLGNKVEDRIPIYALSTGSVSAVITHKNNNEKIWALYVKDNTTYKNDPFTICYLHLDFDTRTPDEKYNKKPLIRYGDKINKGDLIGYEYNRSYLNDENPTTLHTHIEINPSSGLKNITMAWDRINTYVTVPHNSNDLPKFPTDQIPLNDEGKPIITEANNYSAFGSSYKEVLFNEFYTKNYFSLNPYPYIDKLFSNYK